MLKKLLSILLLIAAGSAVHAQATPDTLMLGEEDSYTQVWDSLFDAVSKEHISSGILYNRAVDLIGLSEFREDDTLNKDFFVQAWSQLYTAAYDNGRYDNVDLVHNRVALAGMGDTLLLGTIHSKFQYITPEAFEHGHLVYAGGLILEGEQPEMAFAEQQVALAAILTNTLQPNKTYTLLFEGANLEQHPDLYISSVDIELPGIDKITLLPGQSFSFSTDGFEAVQVIGIDITLSNSAIVRLRQLFKMSTMNGSVPSALLHESCEGAKELMVADLPYLGGVGQAEVTTFYHSTSPTVMQCEQVLRKPIIVLDGIENHNGENSTLRRDAKKIYEKYLNYYKSATGYQIGDSLRLMGYDLVIFDPIMYGTGINTIDGGDDYIQRNAFILVKLIKQLRDELAANDSDEEIVIVGPSMGGQVSRYALLYMEQQYALTNDPDWLHHCRLWAAFDSPHDGANIPVSIAQYLKFWGKKVGSPVAKNKFVEYLTAPASRQLLINQVQQAQKSINLTYLDNTSPDRVTFMNELNDMGKYPSLCRKVAMANGRRALGDYHTSCETMFNFYTEGTRTWMSIPFVGVSENKFFPAKNESCKPFVGKFFLEHIPGISLLYFNSYSNNITNNSNYGFLDACPGSYFDVQGDLYEEVPFFEIDGYNTTLSIFSNKTHNITFIPTVSALGLKNIDFNWSNGIPSGDLVCSNQTYFDAYFVPNENENHVTFSEESWRWLKQEIEYGKKDCPYICASALNGEEGVLCPGTYYTYTLNQAVPPGAVTQWSASADVYIVPPPVTKNSSVTIWVPDAEVMDNQKFVQATIIPKMNGTQCGAAKVIRKELNFGRNHYDYVYSDLGSNKFEVEVSPHVLGAQYSWALDNVNFEPVGYSYSKTNLNKTPANSQNNYFFSTRVYPPGCSTYYTMESIYWREGLAFPIPTSATITLPKTITLTPNPAADYWHVYLGTEFEDDKAHVQVYDNNGKLIDRFELNETKSLSIPIQHYAAGVYLVRIESQHHQQTIKAVKQ